MAGRRGQAPAVVEGFAESLELARAGRRGLPQERSEELIGPETETPASVAGKAPFAVEAEIDQSSHAPTTVRLSEVAADGLWDAWVHWARTTEPWLRQTELVSRYVMEGIARDLERLGMPAFPVAPKRPKRSTK